MTWAKAYATLGNVMIDDDAEAAKDPAAKARARAAKTKAPGTVDIEPQDAEATSAAA